MRLRLLTYNIHKGIGGVDRRYDLGRIVEVIAHYEPDVALLQEVDEGVPRSRGDRQAELLAERLGMPHFLFQPNVKLRRGAYGNATLSRLPLHDRDDVELTIRPKKRRRALVATLRLEEGGHSRSVVLVNLHLGLAGFERRMQVQRLIASEALTSHHAHTPCVVGGDFNDVWGAIGPRRMTPGGFEKATGLMRTFPAIAPARPLDGVYHRGDCEATGAFAGRIQAARRASDHLPLVVDFEIGGPQSP
ncbi:hypothetical protein Mal64_15540 [Pseudobythopirellula maris]|uniref:Endonuclease/exonuclease/phosphatase domain-containing protein n=1 Tax=Pseudobythopirellula maris TaxID=2527991 RepID=A0A5C5ZKX3_9BACT|nr:endonuclease/exonuclease/phosphatase family protein [Pseudobythopirellula maris]TWT88082.1 hypothetical protein Mal64_15540 [Pseudobythopirellula maris]